MKYGEKVRSGLFWLGMSRKSGQQPFKRKNVASKWPQLHFSQFSEGMGKQRMAKMRGKGI